MLKDKPLFKNILINIFLQITVICNGLIVPRLIIGAYGSNINGMIISITQFLSYITLLESGIGGVIKSVLYKPLLNKDKAKLSGIVKATDQFFQKIAYIFIVYLVLMICFYDKIAQAEASWAFSACMVAILGISILVQYFLGLTYQTLLQADQKHWLTSGVQIITIFISIISTIILINIGCSVHVLKLITALIFVVRPLVFRMYVRKKYDIDKNALPDKTALSQRWNGLGHHIAYFIHTNTDVILLTIFISTTEVSVYSVYYMVVSGVKAILGALSSAVEPYFGRIIASDEKEKLVKTFNLYEYVNFLCTTVIFATTSVMIVPFVNIYISGVTDANYIRPLFSFLLVVAEGLYCLRAPYSCVIFASGHFKQTMKGAFVEASINIVLSLILIKPLGIIGIAIGTLVAMAFRTIQYAVYLSKNLIRRSIFKFFRKIVAVIIVGTIIFHLTRFLILQPNDYLQWVGIAILAFIAVTMISCICFFICDFQETKYVYKRALRIFKHSKVK